MADISLSAKSHLDFAGLGNLKARAKRDDAGAAEEVGQQFEAMFIQMMFKSMREANAPMKSDLMGSSSQDTFEQMYHEELSQVMAQNGAFGMGKWISEQVKGAAPSKAIEAYEQMPAAGMAIQKAPAKPINIERGDGTSALPLNSRR
ncbi:Peptidoglycan hydrolase FlgJ [Gammaproteobacteria bacterium MOLA455]|nr:Peptidoglycan hydrolase FlgJ [Gammaproteobacteria bacterium MOLA455]